jgi:hypothetical protein
MAATMDAAAGLQPLQSQPTALPTDDTQASAAEASTYKLVHRPWEVIQEGTSVLLDINGEKTSFAVVKNSS